MERLTMWTAESQMSNLPMPMHLPLVIGAKIVHIPDILQDFDSVAKMVWIVSGEVAVALQLGH